MKDWLQALEWPGKIAGCLAALWTLVLLVPKAWRRVKALYEAIMAGIEIPERLDEIMTFLAKIDRGQSHMIQTRRVLLDRETANAFFECDPQGGCQWVSRYWRKLTGLDIDDARGNGWELGIAPNDRERVVTAWKVAIEKRRPFEEVLTYVDRDGITTRMHVFVSPIKDDETGELIGWFGVGAKPAV